MENLNKKNVVKSMTTKVGDYEFQVWTQPLDLYVRFKIKRDGDEWSREQYVISEPLGYRIPEDIYYRDKSGKHTNVFKEAKEAIMEFAEIDDYFKRNLIK